MLPLSSHALPSFAAVQASYRPSDALLLARDGRPLHELRVDFTVRRLAWTPLADISPALVRAVIASEDRRFLEHAGVDWLAAGSAAWNNLRGKPTRGASTLSMQLAGLIAEDGARRGRRDILGKLSQTAAALRLERSWDKGQIVEAYLNLVAFRGELQGVAAMSRQLFGKWPHGLNDRESALAAVLLRAPNAPAATLARRACALLKELDRASECRALEAFAFQVVQGYHRASPTSVQQPAPQFAPHLARKLLNLEAGNRKTSLDADLQQFANESLRRQLAGLRNQNVEDGAILVSDNATGEILAWIGSSGDLSGAAEVDGATALRQAGSTLKPFLFAQAFEWRLLTPATLLEDAPLSLDTGNGLYTPQNYVATYRGWVSARQALAGSLNVPAVKTLIAVGTDAFHQRLHAYGFASLKEDGDWYGYSLALGSADVSLLMLNNAFRSLANQGRWSPLRVTPTPGRKSKTTPEAAPQPCTQGGCAGVFSGAPRQVGTPASSFLATDILADRNARAGTFGLESWLSTPYWSAVKTGTSKDMRDNWCVGFSRRYTVAVWVGNASGAPMHDVSGISGAAPVWREIMDWLQRGDAAQARASVISQAPEPPQGVTGVDIRFEPPSEPPRREWFLQGSEMRVVRAAQQTALARIAYPANGTLIALDADIPPARQLIPLRLTAPAARGWYWQIGKQRLPITQNSAQSIRWRPQPGRHQLSLHDAQGQVLDASSFEVRALRGKAQARAAR